MMLKRSKSKSGSKSAQLLRAGFAALLSIVATAPLSTGCLDRPVAPATPRTSNVYVDQIRQTAVDKIDLVFMIDNSISMGDKQEILAQAVPVLMRRLIQPVLIDGEPEFTPINDIHVAVVTSSLGAHGGQVCLDADGSDDDHGRALGAVRQGLNHWDNTGFLAWDPLGTKNMPPGTAMEGTFTADFTAMVEAANENGCGYEASLEAWYRFLIDPQPLAAVANVGGATVAMNPGTNQPCAALTEPGCLDDVVLAQRNRFLRADSLVAVIMLTDENDCSIRDDSVGWLVGLQNVNNIPFTMPRATLACQTNPNDICCRSCASSEPNGPPAGCTTTVGQGSGSDPECTRTGGALDAGANEDQANLRCYNQKQRFGFDLLYPAGRYVAGLASPQIYDRTNALVQNPLFAPKDDKPPRDKNLVFLAGIVGVPWQDIATDDSLGGAGLTYLTSSQMNEAIPNRWNVILGDPVNYIPPTDAFMIETPLERAGTNPITMTAISPSNANQPNAINGKEQTPVDNSDLQYACTFPLGTPRDCTDETCDCGPGSEPRNRTLCSQSGAGAVGSTQYHAKAYPGLRHLQVLKDFGNNAIVASICPKNPTSNDPGNDPNYGYNPAVAAIVDRLKEALKGRCLPRQLVADDPATDIIERQVPCAVIEATPSSTGCAPCDGARRRADPATQEIQDAVRKQLNETGVCGDAPLQACGSFCLCEILQTVDADLDTCQNQVQAPTNIFGYCYIDQDQGIGNPEILASCPDTSKRLLRFVGDNTPANGAIAFIACFGATIGGAAAAPPAMM